MNLFCFCKHEWEIKEEHKVEVYDTWDGKRLTEDPSSRIKFVLLRCKKCGDIKAKRIKY